MEPGEGSIRNNGGNSMNNKINLIDDLIKEIDRVQDPFIRQDIFKALDAFNNSIIDTLEGNKKIEEINT